MRLILAMVAAMLSLGASPTAAATTEVFVLGALHGLHEQEESFDYAKLGQVIEAIKPDVILLEVTPEELAGRLETKGRPEYPKVIWPMLAAGGPKAYAMEAAQPLYGELTSGASKTFADFKREFPAEDAALTGLATSNSNVLLAHWKSVADTQGEATDALSRARAQLTAAMVPAFEAGQKSWDGTMVDSTRAAIAANRDKRILVLGSYRNRFMFVDALNGMKDVQLTDMKAWLNANGFGRQVPG